MKELMIKPDIYHFDTVRSFVEEFQIGEGDLVVTNEYIYKPFFGELDRDRMIKIYKELF